ncbi:mechanosensitive ion channel [Alcaligenaceae bacterium]|nr:mechanosensitive ion channel [Alcaligenaceae bacterium]
MHLRHGGPSRFAATVRLVFFTFLLFALFIAAPAQGQGQGQTQAGAAAGEPSSAGVSYGALADVLEDPAARDRLVEQLRELSQAQGGATADAAGAPGAASARPAASRDGDGRAAEGPVLSQRLGHALQAVTAQLGADVENTVDAFSNLGTSDGLTEGMLDAWLPALRLLALVIAVTLVAYAVLRAVAGLLFGRLNTWIRREPTVTGGSAAESPSGRFQGRRAGHRFGRLTLSRKLLGVLLALFVDLGATLLAALIGYVAAAALSDRDASSALFAFQFLTAFVLIEAAKSVSRAVFATRYEHLRLLPMEPATAAYWNRWITLLMALTGYCLLVVVPVGQAVFEPSIARLIGLVIMLCVYITGVRVVWSQKATVRASLTERAHKTDTAVFGTLLRALARTWHWLALAYFTVLLVASQAAQAEALAFMVAATVQSLVAVVAGALLAAGLTRLESRHMMLPESWNRNFPLLERRVNGYKDPALRGLRLALLVIVALLVFDAWRAFDLSAWLDSDRGRATLALIFRVGVVLGAAALAWTVLASLIEHRLGATDVRRASEREKTLLMLFRNAAAIVIATMTVLVLLSQIGIDIGPLIAGAGVVGLAIGFGAQKLVQDVITGVFIQLENGMNQNDIVEVAGRFGTVEKITVRSVVVRTLDGGYHLIPFSAIDTVSNHTRDFGYHYGEYNIAHREDVDQAVAELEMAFKDLMQDPALAAEVLADIEIPGVTALNERGFTVRVLIKTAPGSQWMIQRGFNRLVKQRFDAAGIELPYPQTVVHFGRDRNGHAAAVDVRAVEALRQSADAPDGGSESGPGGQGGSGSGGSGQDGGGGPAAGAAGDPREGAGTAGTGVVPAPGQTLRPGPASGQG